MRRLSLFLMLALCACAGAKYPRGPSALEEARGPVTLVHQPAPGELVYLEVLVRAGSAHDPIGSEGLAHLTARLLREGGAGKRSPEAVEAVLYRMGTDIEVVVDRETVAFRTTCVVEDAPKMAALLGDMLMAPRLELRTLQRLWEEALTTLKRGITQNDEGLGEALLDARLYAGHGYAHPVQGRAGVVPLLSEDQVRRFLQDRYVRPAIVLGVAGAAPPELAVSLRARLSESPATLYRDVTPRAMPIPRGRRLLVVEKQTVATGIHFGHPTRLSRSHPDWPAMMLATTALGEHRQSHGRLYQALREERGLNYGDYAYVERYRQDGWSHRQQTGTGRVDNVFYVWIRPVEPGNAPFALKSAVDIVETWVKDGLTEDEFTSMQGYLQSRIALWAADPGRRLGWATEAALMGWPNPVETLPAQVAALSRAQVNEAIKRHIHPADLDIVAVTADATSLAEALRQEDPTPVTYGGEPPEKGSPRVVQDARISEIKLGIDAVQIISTEDLFR
jgi:zinc protease